MAGTACESRFRDGLRPTLYSPGQVSDLLKLYGTLQLHMSIGGGAAAAGRS